MPVQFLSNDEPTEFRDRKKDISEIQALAALRESADDM